MRQKSSQIGGKGPKRRKKVINLPWILLNRNKKVKKEEFLQKEVKSHLWSDLEGQMPKSMPYSGSGLLSTISVHAQPDNP